MLKIFKSRKQKTKTESDLRLHDAVYNPDTIEEIKKLLAEKKCLVFEIDDEGRTPLHTLSIAGDEEGPEIAKLLFDVSKTNSQDGKKIGFNNLLNIGDSKGFMALHYAARNFHPQLVKVLMLFGTNPLLQDKRGNIALHFAAEGVCENALECVRTILNYEVQNGIMLTLNNNDGLTPVDIASTNRSSKINRFFKLTQLKYVDYTRSV